MPVHLDVWSDFVCPWCFLVAMSLEKLKQSTELELQWRSFELRPQGSPPMPPAYRAQIEARRPMFRAAVKQQFGIEMKEGPFGIDSRPALIGSKFAEATGFGDAYHHDMSHAYWVEGLDISDKAVMEQIVINIGMDADDFFAALEDPQYDEAVSLDILMAHQMGIGGVPALLFERKYYISGAQPYEVLADIVEKIQSGEIEQQ